MDFIVTMSKSHKKSWLLFSPKRVLFLVREQKPFLKVNFSPYHLLLFWKQILYQEIKQSLLKFLRDFWLISWHKDHFQNNNKYEGKN